MDSLTLEKIKLLLSPKVTFIPFGRKKTVLELLDDPVFSENPETIKYLMEIVLDRQQDLALKAVECIKKNVSRLGSNKWLWLEEDFRRGFYWSSKVNFPRERWVALRPDDVERFKRFEENSLLLIGLLSFHNNGYIRQSALMILDRFSTGEELRFLLLRANDWVPPIRKLTSECLAKRITEENLGAWLSNMPFLYRLNNCVRQDHMLLIGKVEELFVSLPNGDLLYKGLNSSEKTTRRECYRLLWRTKENNILLLKAGLASPDVFIQRAAINMALSVSKEIGADFLYKLLKNSRSVMVRSNALDLLEECREFNLVEECKGKLTDSSLSVRGSARYWLGKYGVRDFALYYRDALEKGSEVLGSVHGLGETGAKEDAELLAPYLNCKRLKVKKAAMKAVARLNIEPYIGFFIEALGDEHRGVSSEARRVLVNKTYMLDEKKIWSLLHKPNIPEHVLVNVIPVFAGMSKWRALVQFLKMDKINYPGIDGRINEMLRAWLIRFNRSYTNPNETERNSIRQLLGKAIKIDPYIRRQIDFLMG